MFHHSLVFKKFGSLSVAEMISWAYRT